MSAPAMDLDGMIAPRRARLARYGWWQLRDYAITRGAPTFLMFAMFGGLAIFTMLKTIEASIARMPQHFLQQRIAKYGTAEAFRLSMIHDASKGFLTGFVGAVVFFGAVFATYGLVSNDRRNGFYRFLFSKPLSPVRYYAQAFLLHWVGFLITASLLALLYGACVEPVLTPTFLLILGAVFLMYAGIGFLLTSFVRLDWLVLGMTVISAQALWDIFGKSESVFARLLYLLPPVHRVPDVYAALISGTALPWHTVQWIAGYGAVCLIAGLIVLRTQRLAIS